MRRRSASAVASDPGRSRPATLGAASGTGCAAATIRPPGNRSDPTVAATVPDCFVPSGRVARHRIRREVHTRDRDRCHGAKVSQVRDRGSVTGRRRWRRGLGRLIPEFRHPSQVVVVGFAATIAVGTVVLSLPMAKAGPGSAGVLEALFTATSAVCVTGLIVVDTGSYW